MTKSESAEDRLPRCVPPGRNIGDLPLPDPYPDYLPCPHCGEPEVEVWCFQVGVTCHACGGWIEHDADVCLMSEKCRTIRKGL